ncbi:hypothetical protein Psch_01734 [Pelotomaculum schinkii]|uniref:Antitoxin SocA-like Panacea domain-containing protein n=2 Tax=Pelotomaculum TaxID=191373 RepID=A0A4Y7RHD9_9FIRM|nr:type II toxin-antitoxin system antitoxin SocA domain-containing protein [Pelotomaculum schinkii]TEB08179.1 hypothetical protein Psch_01734 [Pelotomaculum schinkii]TEB14226.1 hypothetical protein Psfp_03047 [Pelotomaculum sp. FP]
MVNNLRRYIKTLESICEDRKLGKKAVQKLMYLIERKGVEFDLGYNIHFFGPYSAKLDNILHRLESDEVIEIDTTGRTHTISVMDSSRCEGEELSSEDKKTVEYVISRFGNKTAFELEGIATLDYVACNLVGSEGKSDIDIINGVKRIKGTKFNNSQLSQYLEILKENHYLS